MLVILFKLLKNKVVNKSRLILCKVNIKLSSFIHSEMSEEVIDIDGGIMEGGGQILRMAAAFSALLKKPVHVRNIRAGRNNPGLRPQHLAGLELVRDICDGKLEGGNIGSTEVTFYPTSIQSGRFNADPGTAGSIMLLFQVSLPCLLFVESPTQLYLKGGTNAEMAPQIDYTLMIFQPIAERFGVTFGCDIMRRGYYPKGGGEVVIKTSPTSGSLKPVELLDPGRVVRITGRAFVAGVLPIKMAHGMADAALKVLRESFPGVSLTIDRIKESPNAAFGNGSGIIIVAETSTGCLFGGSALGKRGMLVEDVGHVAANELVEDICSGGCVDRHLQDQLIMFMALASGKSRIRCGSVTLHTETAIYIAELLSEAKFNIVKEEAKNTYIIECQGIGLSR